MQIALRHPGTEQFKFIDSGWSWTIFLGAAFFGLPLFFRGLAFWGTVMVVVWCLRILGPIMADSVATAASIEWFFILAVLGLSVFLGLKGNLMSARHYIACGYQFAKPDSTEARVGARLMGL